MNVARSQLLRQAARLKGRSGRRGLPPAIAAAMVADYARLGSVAKVARAWARTPQAMWELLFSRGCKLKPDSRELCRNRPAGERVKFAGRIFTPSKRGYLRATDGPREPLHHAVWRKHFGPIPAGMQVSFRNGDFKDYRPANLFCGTAAEVTRQHQRRLHPATACLSPFERRAHRKENSLRCYYRKKQERLAAGLRTDGKPRAEQLGPQRLALLLAGQGRLLAQLRRAA